MSGPNFQTEAQGGNGFPMFGDAGLPLMCGPDAECCPPDEVCDARFNWSLVTADPCVILFVPAVSAPPGSTYLWDFGDGSTSSLESPTHEFVPRFSYLVRLTVTLPTAESCFTEQYVGCGLVECDVCQPGTSVLLPNQLRLDVVWEPIAPGRGEAEAARLSGTYIVDRASCQWNMDLIDLESTLCLNKRFKYQVVLEAPLPRNSPPENPPVTSAPWGAVVRFEHSGGGSSGQWIDSIYPYYSDPRDCGGITLGAGEKWQYRVPIFPFPETVPYLFCDARLISITVSEL